MEPFRQFGFFFSFDLRKRFVSLSLQPPSTSLEVIFLQFCALLKTGEVVLVDIEDSSPVHKLNVKAEVTALNWALHVPEETAKKKTVFEVRLHK